MCSTNWAISLLLWYCETAILVMWRGTCHISYSLLSNLHHCFMRSVFYLFIYLFFGHYCTSRWVYFHLWKVVFVFNSCITLDHTVVAILTSHWFHLVGFFFFLRLFNYYLYISLTCFSLCWVDALLMYQCSN